MEFRSIFLYVVISSAFFGVALVLAPSQTGAFYGAPMGDAWPVLLGRYFGATLLMYGAAVWGLRGLSDPGAEKSASAGRRGSPVGLEPIRSLGVSADRHAAARQVAVAPDVVHPAYRRPVLLPAQAGHREGRFFA